jgi:hypothetical protein
MKAFLLVLLFACGLCHASAILPDAYTFSYIGNQQSGVQLHSVVVGSFTFHAPGDLTITSADLTTFNMSLIETTGPMFGSTMETFQLGIADLNNFQLDIPDNMLAMSVQLSPGATGPFATFRVFSNNGVFQGLGPNVGSVGLAPATFTLTPAVAPEPATYALIGCGLVGFACCVAVDRKPISIES